MLSMKKTKWILSCAMVASLALGLNACDRESTTGDGISEADTAAVLDEFAQERNDFTDAVRQLRDQGVEDPRDGRQLPPTRRLRTDDRLAEAAAAHAVDMARHRFFDHIGTDGSNLAHRLTSADYEGDAVIEEFWATSGTPDDLAEAAILSFAAQADGMRHPLFARESTSIGVAFAKTDDGGHVAVVLVASE